MSNLSIEQRLFKRAFHSEADRQALIDKKSAEIEMHLSENILSRSDIKLEVGGNMVGFFDENIGALMCDCITTRNKDALFQLLHMEYRKAITRTADDHATKQVEAMTAEDFLP